MGNCQNYKKCKSNISFLHTPLMTHKPTCKNLDTLIEQLDRLQEELLPFRAGHVARDFVWIVHANFFFAALEAGVPQCLHIKSCQSHHLKMKFSWYSAKMWNKSGCIYSTCTRQISWNDHLEKTIILPEIWIKLWFSHHVSFLHLWIINQMQVASKLHRTSLPLN